MPSEQNSIITPAEAAALFHDLEALPAVLLAVSGGPDSTALMLLAARWRAGLARGPRLIAATVDHGLRAEAAAEARAVAKLARTLGIAHRTLRWTGKKPATGLQEAARAARYGLLAKAAREAGASAIVTAHTLDDQAETVLIRMTRGSGLTGLAAIRQTARVPGGANGLTLVRPLLSLPKSRLIATLRAENIPFAEDPSNRDPRFTRARLRGLMPPLAEEGLDARRLALLAERLARADAALDEIANRTYACFAESEAGGQIALPRGDFTALPVEIRLRLLARAIGEMGHEGPVELGKLEALEAALAEADAAQTKRFRRTLAGAIVTLSHESVTVEPAPARRSRRLTAQKGGRRKMALRR
jgi:tRNA(Ile)-lysidine synthase